jgi:hypothetical protein
VLRVSAGSAHRAERNSRTRPGGVVGGGSEGPDAELVGELAQIPPTSAALRIERIEQAALGAVRAA